MLTLAQGQLRASRALSRFYHAFYNWNASLVSSNRHPLHTCSTHRNTAAPVSISGLARKTQPKEDSGAGLKIWPNNWPVEAHESSIAEISPDLDIPTRDLRITMRDQTQPVALITAGLYDSDSQLPREFHAMTISSFTSVSMSKRPMVSFNIKIPSGTHLAISGKSKPTFRISLLKATPAAAQIAHQFTLGNAKESLKTLQFLGIQHEWPVNQPPRFPNAASAELLCKVFSQMPVDDHHVIIASVHEVSLLSRERSLCYQNKRYHKSGPPLENLAAQWSSQERTADDIRYLSTRIRRYLEPYNPAKRAELWRDRGVHGILQTLNMPQFAYNETDLDLTVRLLGKDPAMSEVMRMASSIPDSNDQSTDPATKHIQDVAQRAVECLYSSKWQEKGMGHPTSIGMLAVLLRIAGFPDSARTKHVLTRMREQMIKCSAQFRKDEDEIKQLLNRAQAIIRREYSHGVSQSAIEKMCEDNVWFDQRETSVIGMNRLRRIIGREILRGTIEREIPAPATKSRLEADEQDINAGNELSEVQSLFHESNSWNETKETRPAIQQSHLENDDADTQPASQHSKAELEEAPHSSSAPQLIEEIEKAETHPGLPQTVEEIEEAETQLSLPQDNENSAEVETLHDSQHPDVVSEEGEIRLASQESVTEIEDGATPLVSQQSVPESEEAGNKNV